MYEVAMQAYWQIAPEEIFSDQYRRQTKGWPESWACIKEAFQKQGPFQGILGFSQVRNCECSPI